MYWGANSFFKKRRPHFEGLYRPEQQIESYKSCSSLVTKWWKHRDASTHLKYKRFTKRNACVRSCVCVFASLVKIASSIRVKPNFYPEVFLFFFFLVFLINVVMWFPSLWFKVIHMSSHVLNTYNIYFVLLFWLRIKSDIQNPCRTLA